MQKKVIIAIAVIIVIVIIAYYFLTPEPAVSLEIQELLIQLCIRQAPMVQHYLETAPQECEEPDLLCKALVEKSVSCAELSFQRFACDAVVRGDLLYFDSDQLEKDCTELAVLEAALESQKKRNCRKVDNIILKSECESILS